MDVVTARSEVETGNKGEVDIFYFSNSFANTVRICPRRAL